MEHLPQRFLGAHEKVALWYGAANRDPAIFENPDEFNILRKNADKHLAFGIGRHTCLGKPVALMHYNFDGDPTCSRLSAISTYAVSEGVNGVLTNYDPKFAHALAADESEDITRETLIANIKYDFGAFDANLIISISPSTTWCYLNDNSIPINIKICNIGTIIFASCFHSKFCSLSFV